MSMTTTTQPTTTASVGTRAPRITEGIRLIRSAIERVRYRWQKRPVTELTRDEQIARFVKEQRLHPYGKCRNCDHLIDDVFGQ